MSCLCEFRQYHINTTQEFIPIVEVNLYGVHFAHA